MKNALLLLFTFLALILSNTSKAQKCFRGLESFQHLSNSEKNSKLIEDLLSVDRHGVIKKALNFSARKHMGQRRKFDGRPYFDHPVRVAHNVKIYGGDIDLIIAALLHDTIEDTDTTYEEILSLFGPKVALIVKQLTNDPIELEKTGKKKYLIAKLNKISSPAFFVKLCDRLDNVSDLSIASGKFIHKYTNETNDVLKSLHRSLDTRDIQVIRKIKELIFSANTSLEI